MGCTRDFDVVLVLGGAEEVEGLHEKKGTHEKVDPVEGAAVGVAKVEPEAEEGEVGDGEEGEKGGKLGLAGGEVVAGVVGVEVVERRVDRHGDGGFGRAIGEEETVFIGDCNGEGAVDGGGWRGRKVAEGEKALDVVRVKDAEARVLLDLN